MQPCSHVESLHTLFSLHIMIAGLCAIEIRTDGTWGNWVSCDVPSILRTKRKPWELVRELSNNKLTADKCYLVNWACRKLP
jgi:hypothetical protein